MRQLFYNASFLDLALIKSNPVFDVGVEFAACPATFTISLKPSTLTGEGLGGGDPFSVNSEDYLITLPLIPSRRGRGNELLDSLLFPARSSNRAGLRTGINRLSRPLRVKDISQTGRLRYLLITTPSPRPYISRQKTFPDPAED